MPLTLNVLIADSAESAREYLAKVMTLDSRIGPVAFTDHPAGLPEAVAAGTVDVAVVGLGPGGDWLGAIEAAITREPSLQVVALGSTGTREEMRAAMVAGCRVFLTTPCSSDELLAAIAAAAAHRKPVSDVPAAAPAELGRVVAVVGSRGGVGRSTIALNVAVAASRDGTDTVLVDANPGFGDITLLAGVLRVEQALSDAVADPDRVEEMLIPGPAGVQILPASVGPVAAELVTAIGLRTVLEQLRDRHELVIVDVPCFLDEAHMTVLALADELIIPVAAELAAVKNTRAYLDVLEMSELPPRRLVLNRSGESSQFKDAEISSVLGEFGHVLEYDPIGATRAANRGIPLVISEPHSNLARGLVALASAVVGKAIEPPVIIERKATRLARMFGAGRPQLPAEPLALA